MKSNIKRKILIGFFLLSIAAVSIGFYMFNKGPVNVKNASAIDTNAAELYSIFETDSIAANKKYSGKVVRVNGIVKEVSSNQNNETVVLLTTSANGGNINATLEEAKSGLKAGETVFIKGICSGIGESEPDLGIKADVYLTSAYITQ